MKPQFEATDENHEFHIGDEVYLIDNNKVDIFKAKIDKVNKKSFMVSFLDHNDEPKKVLSPKRLLLATPTNNAIYEEQEQNRKKVEEALEAKKIENPEEAKLEEISEETKEEKKEETENKSEEINEDQKNTENNSEQKPTKTHKVKIVKRRKIKKPIFDQQLIIRTAWHNGIHDVSQFHKYVKRNIKSLVAEFEKYHIMMNAAEEPPFSLGGGMGDSDITKFWTNARNQWKKLFDDCEAVSTDEFIKKTASAFKLQNQTESNAKETLQFFFDLEASSSTNQTNFFQFCALLALFGPTQTMFRKIGHFFHCPACLKDSLTYTDVIDVKDADENTYLNEFILFTGTNQEKIVYNIPFATTDEQYIVDDEGNKYDSWLKVFDFAIDQKVEEEAAAVNSPTPIPIEAS